LDDWQSGASFEMFKRAIPTSYLALIQDNEEKLHLMMSKKKTKKIIQKKESITQ
jgi:hypothetical protein